MTCARCRQQLCSCTDAEWRGVAVPGPVALRRDVQRYGRPGSLPFCAGAASTEPGDYAYSPAFRAMISHAVVEIVDRLHGRVIRTPLPPLSARIEGHVTGQAGDAGARR